VIGASKKTDQLEEGYIRGPAGELIPDYDTNFKYFNDGDLIDGVVVGLERDEVLVDVGYKSEGVIPLKELSVSRNVNPKELLEEGQEIKIVVVQKEDSEGRLILSKKRADYEEAWEEIEVANKEGKCVNGKVVEIVKGGLILNVGVRGFLPASLIELTRVKELDQYRGQELECKIIEINRSRNNVVLSRKAILNTDQNTEKQKVLEKLNVGENIKGQISSIVDFGAFVDLGGVDGLIHISEISWDHVNHPSEVLSVNQEVEVQVLDIDNKKARVSLGLKQTQDDPWKEQLDGYEIDQEIKGKITKILPFGVFIEFDDLEGLIHISELSAEHIEDPKEAFEVGQEVTTKLIGIDLSRRRISLSIKQMQSEATKDASKEEKEVKAEEKKVAAKAETEDTKAATKEDVASTEETKEAEAEIDEKEVKAEEKKVAAKAKTEETKEPEAEIDEKEEVKAEKAKKATKTKKADKKEDKEKKPISKEDEGLLEKLAHGPTKIEDEKVDNVPEANTLEDVLDQMKKSHGAKK